MTRAMKSALAFAAAGEAATGVALLLAPSLVGRLLLGGQLTGIAVPVARVAGIATNCRCVVHGVVRRERRLLQGRADALTLWRTIPTRRIIPARSRVGN